MSHRSASLSLSAIRLPRSTAFEKAASKVSASSVMLSAALHRWRLVYGKERDDRHGPKPHGPDRAAARVLYAMPATEARRLARASWPQSHRLRTVSHLPAAAYVACTNRSLKPRG